MRIPHANILRLFLCLTLSGCATGVPVRHLSSDVCLVMPESTTKSEVQSFLGTPDKRTGQEDGDETWYYYKKNESFLRKLPLIGENLGWSNVETVTVTFIGDQVRTCIYRQLEQEEFKELNIPSP